MKYLIPYLASLATLLILDFLWLGVVAKNFFKGHLDHLFRADMLWGPVAVFYLLYSAAIIYFAVLPAGDSWQKAMLAGALLGATAYMTYELVNYATLKDWPFAVILVDIAWGALLTSCAAAVAALANKL